MGYAPTAALNTKLRRNIGRNSLRGSTLLLYRLRCSHKESTSADQVKADIDFLRCTAALTIVACLCFSEIVGYQQGDLRHGLPTVMICQPDSNSLNGPVNGGRPIPTPSIKIDRRFIAFIIFQSFAVTTP